MEQWYDPSLLDEFFTQFDKGEAFRIDDDEFSLPDEDEETSRTEGHDGDDTSKIDAVDHHHHHQYPAKAVPPPPPKAIALPVAAAAQQQSSTRKSTSPKTDRKSPLTTTSDNLAAIPSKTLKSHGGSDGSGTRKHVAGFSTVHKVVKCCDAPASTVDVRQKNYKKLGQKAPSEQSLYEFAALDVLRGKKKVCKVFSQVQLPWLSEGAAYRNGLPQVLIVNMQLPNKGPQMFRSAADTDPGTSLVFYFTLRPVLPADSSVTLAAKFFAGTVQGRFKTMSFVDNLSDLKFPSFLSGTMQKFNGKPVIIHKTGTFFNEGGVFEVDMDVFQFPVLARTALSSSRGTSAHAKTRVAFVIQAESEDELPERLLGCAEVRNLDLDTCAYEKFN